MQRWLSGQQEELQQALPSVAEAMARSGVDRACGRFWQGSVQRTAASTQGDQRARERYGCVPLRPGLRPENQQDLKPLSLQWVWSCVQSRATDSGTGTQRCKCSKAVYTDQYLQGRQLEL